MKPTPFYVQYFALAEQNSNDPLYQMQKICRHSREGGNPDLSARKFIE
ncbi:TPA: restriction endonuclease subunit M [Neisseria gonorrhoeae]